ncbi:MAG: hypothetical protein RIB58_13335 [Phycisphaerales bacterium]|jgi:hypothetical protein
MPRPFPTVLLRHDLPDGSHHFDWLIDRDGQGPLLTFRLDADLRTGPPSFEAVLLPDHRRRYLDYEGPVSGGRGSVQRLWRGQGVLVVEEADRVVVRVEIAGHCHILGGIRQEKDRFLFRSDPDS